nr:MAG TPA: hypothetical protein [Bacteriophage sp.]
MITFKSKKDVASVEAIFSEINARMIAALMFHSQMADYFDFLGLRGYKRLHEYQYVSEGKERCELNRYYINHHNRMIPDRYEGSVQMIPEGWKNANRISVGKSTKQKAVEDGFNEYRQWESDTKALYEKYAVTLRDDGHIADALRVEMLVDDVDGELKCLERMLVDLISAGYDMVYIVESQNSIHDRYKRKTAKVWEV